MLKQIYCTWPRGPGCSFRRKSLFPIINHQNYRSALVSRCPQSQLNSIHHCWNYHDFKYPIIWKSLTFGDQQWPLSWVTSSDFSFFSVVITTVVVAWDIKTIPSGIFKPHYRMPSDGATTTVNKLHQNCGDIKSKTYRSTSCCSEVRRAGSNWTGKINKHSICNCCFFLFARTSTFPF